jgi:hypothetical protein
VAKIIIPGIFIVPLTSLYQPGIIAVMNNSAEIAAHMVPGGPGKRAPIPYNRKGRGSEPPDGLIEPIDFKPFARLKSGNQTKQKGV